MKMHLILALSLLALNTAVSQTPANKGSAGSVKAFGKLSKNRISLSSKDRNWTIKLNQALKENSQSKNAFDTLFITFTEGTYHLKETINFGNKVTGNKTPPIVIKGIKKVIISGGTTLDGLKFTPISNLLVRDRIISREARSQVLEYDLKKNGINDLGELKCIGFGRESSVVPVQLFYNGNRMTLARYPNSVDMALLKKRTSVIPINKIINQGIKTVTLPLNPNDLSISNDQRGEFEYTDDRAAKWVDAKDVWLDGVFARDWAWSFNKVKKIDTAKRSIMLEYNEKYELTNRKTFFFACNLIEEIDVPGEYYIDREIGKLYFYPPNNFNREKSIIQLSANANDFINIEGAANIKFENISFELGRKNAVNITQSKNITFNNCEFKNFGSTALSIKGSDNVISNCTINDIGGTAIELGGGNLDSLTKGNNTVINCDIYDWAYYNRVYTPAVALSGVGNKVISNKFHNAPHGAITLSGNDQLIAKNEFYDVLHEFKDFGAIYGYLGPLMRGNVIKGNYFHHIAQLGESVFVIYADEATTDWLVEDNIFYKIGSKGARVAAVFSNTGAYLNVKHNLFLECAETLELSFHFSTWAKKKYEQHFVKKWKEQFGLEGNYPAIHLKHYPELKNFMTEDRVYVNTNSFTDNTIGNFSVPLSHSNYFKASSDLPNSDHLIISKNNSYTKDEKVPQFLDMWNNARNKKNLKGKVPALLKQYGYFKD